MRVTALCMEGTLERALGMLLRDEGNKDRVWETLGCEPREQEEGLGQERGDFPCGSAVRNPPPNAGDTGLIPDPGRSHVLRSS